MASITCGHCRSTHGSVADVAQCAWNEAEAEWEAKNDPDAAYERFLENGGQHADRIAWEHQQDELRAACPF